METALQIVSLVMICAVVCVLIRSQSGTMALLLSMLVCVAVLILAVRFFRPVLTLVERLRTLSGVNETLTAPLIKIISIGLLTQLSSGICEDAGERALAKTVEVSGTILSVYLCMPLFNGVLSVLETVLGG